MSIEILHRLLHPFQLYTDKKRFCAEGIGQIQLVTTLVCNIFSIETLYQLNTSAIPLMMKVGCKSNKATLCTLCN